MEFKKGDKVLVEGEVHDGRGVSSDREILINFRENTNYWIPIGRIRLAEPKPQAKCQHWPEKNCESFNEGVCMKFGVGLRFNTARYENCPFQASRKEALSVWDEIWEELTKLLGLEDNQLVDRIFHFIKSKLKEKGHDIQ